MLQKFELMQARDSGMDLSSIAFAFTIVGGNNEDGDAVQIHRKSLELCQLLSKEYRQVRTQHVKGSSSLSSALQ